jgi:hypothetical protein
VDAVLADVNGTIITASDVAIARALSLFGMTPSAAAIQPADVRQLADARLIEAEAVHLQIVPSAADTDLAWQTAVDRLGGQDVLRRWVDRAGLDEGMVRRLLEANLRWRRFIDLRFRPFVFITEEEVTQAIGPGPHPHETRERAIAQLRDAAIAREQTVWLTEARARATIRYGELGAAGMPLPFGMPTRTGP